MDIHSSPKRPRESAQGNMVSQSATANASLWPESQSVTTALLSRALVPACQSLAHHTTPMDRCRQSVDNWAPPYEGPQSRSTTTQSAERLRKTESCDILTVVYYTADPCRRHVHAEAATLTHPARKSRHHPPLPHHTLQTQRESHR
eukprot:scaffold2705_cov109-Isochrysis_galbana.AAC.2